MPVCKKCHEDLPVSSFELEPKMKSGHRSDCHECHKESKRAAYYRSRERVLEAKRAAYAADPVTERQRCLAYYHATREERLSAKKAWRESNPDRYREWNARRRAMKLGNGFEPYRREDIFERDRWVCQICLDPVDPSLEWPHSLSRSIDHIVVLSKGGPDAPGNVRLAHLSCNISRHDGRREIDIRS